jgi:hypothetical protein
MSIVGFGCSNVLWVSQSVSFPSSQGYCSANGIPGSKAKNECNRNLEFHFAPSRNSERILEMCGNSVPIRRENLARGSGTNRSAVV